MMLQLSFLLILACLPSISSEESAPLIDWTTCGTDTKCFCLNNKNELVQEDSIIPKTDWEKCKVGAQTRFLTGNIAVYHLQFDSTTLSLGAKAKLLLYSTDQFLTTELFGCEFDMTNGKTAPAGNAEIIKNYRIEPFENRSRCSKKHCLCSLKLSRANVLEEFSRDNYGNGNTGIKLIDVKTNNAEERKLKVKGNQLFTASVGVKCDPYAFKDVPTSLEYHYFPIKNRDRSVLNCDGYDLDIYAMRYDENGVGNEMKELKCVRNGAKSTDSYIFKIVEDGVAEKNVNNPESVAFFCGAKTEELCKNPVKDCSEFCPEFKPGSKGHPAQLTCDENKWLIDGEYYQLEKSAECLRDVMVNRNEVEFFISPPDGAQLKVKTDARCFKDYDCMKMLKLDFPDCEDLNNCPSISYKDGILKCTDQEIEMTITSTASNSNQTTKSLSCNKRSGLWDTTAKVAITANSRVKCFKSMVIREQPPLEYSSEKIVGILAGSFVGMCIAVALICIAIYKIWEKQAQGHNWGKKMWRKLSKEQQIKKTEKMFLTLMELKRANVAEMKYALGHVNLLLETETVHAEVWDNVYPFLLRFKIFIEKTDHNIWHMFTRYLYLRAKKIIDKHGWTCDKPITRKKPKGLIRSVAIQLLALCLYDPENTEADELLRKGFRKLGFHAKSQYPHCGLMWSVISHTSFKTLQNKQNPTIRRKFNVDAFIEKLSRIALQGTEPWPKKPLALFGTIAEQAAFALGGITDAFYHQHNAREILMNKELEEGRVARSYFDGITCSLARNPAEIIVEAGQFYTESPKFNVGEILTDADRNAWGMKFSNVLNVSTIVGRFLDARRLLGDILPHRKPQELTDFDQAQILFEEMIEKELEDARKFFAAHTDKKEFKAQPVYITEGAVKLDTRVRTGSGVPTQDLEVWPSLATGTPAKDGSNRRSDRTKQQNGSSSSKKKKKKATPAAKDAATVASPRRDHGHVPMSPVKEAPHEEVPAPATPIDQEIAPLSPIEAPARLVPPVVAQPAFPLSPVKQTGAAPGVPLAPTAPLPPLHHAAPIRAPGVHPGGAPKVLVPPPLLNQAVPTKPAPFTPLPPAALSPHAVPVSPPVVAPPAIRPPHQAPRPPPRPPHVVPALVKPPGTPPVTPTAPRPPPPPPLAAPVKPGTAPKPGPPPARFA